MAQPARIYGAGEYPTDKSTCILCDTPDKLIQYYSLRIKYPLSSKAIAARADSVCAIPNHITGYITIRFLINCRGEKTCFHIYQTNADNKNTDWGEAVTHTLKTFVADMPDWPVGTKGGKPIDYHAYLTFKIKNGKIENVIP